MNVRKSGLAGGMVLIKSFSGDEETKSNKVNFSHSFSLENQKVSSGKLRSKSHGPII